MTPLARKLRVEAIERRLAESTFEGRTMRARGESMKHAIAWLLEETKRLECERDAFQEALVVVCNGRRTAAAVAAPLPDEVAEPTPKEET